MLRPEELTGSLLGLLMACSEVHVDPEVTGGSYPVGSQTASTTGTGTASASTGAPAPICEQICEVTGNCFQDCQGMCGKLEGARCAAEAQAYLACIVEHYDAASCATECQCSEEQRQLLECEGSADCGPESCTGGDAGCTCTRQCPFGEQKATCHFAGDQALCTCSFNDQACHYASGPNEGAASCSLTTSACVAYFGPTP